MNRSFWRDRRVLVTGHTGFKGSWLVLLLKELGAEVHGFSLPPPAPPSMFEQAWLKDQCKHNVGDIRDLAAVTHVFQETMPDVVLHMAAQSLVRLSYEEPVNTYAVNVMGTVHVMEACRRTPSVKAAIMVTTDKCYENVGWLWGYRENDRLGGADPYSNSKAACELAVDAYRRSFFAPAKHSQHGLSLASARAGNVIGGGDFSLDRLVPDAMRAFMANQVLRIRNPLSIRPWQHVLEALTGYLMLAERLYEDVEFAQGWNFGPQTDESASVEHVATILAAQWGGGAAWAQDASEQPHEAATLKLDATKARLELGWRPRLTLDDALHLTTEWYRTYHRAGDMRKVTQQQISEYLR